MGRRKEYVVYRGFGGYVCEFCTCQEKELAAMVASALYNYYKPKHDERWHVQIRLRETKTEQNIIYDKSYRDCEFPIE